MLKGVVCCVFNGVMFEEFEFVVIIDDVIDFCYVGEFRYIKGVDFLVDVVFCLYEGGKKVILMFGGDGEEIVVLKV